MQLAALLKDFAIETLQGPTDVEVSALACDSRRVGPGTVFFALPGTVTDGFDFIPQAVAAGACAVIAERLPGELQQQVCYLKVTNVRRTMAQMANIFYAVPTAGIPVIGVTGTNGKTSITYLLENILRQAGYAPAVFGTVEYRFGSERLEASHTTPESLELMRLMGQFRQQGASAMILEVSSHALEQHRVDGIDFDVAVFTNLTPEHLDYHSDLNSYFASKRRLFSELLRDGRAVINRDDGFGRQLLQENHNWISFGSDPAAHFHPLDIRLGREGIKGSFVTPAGAVEIDSRMIGDFNVSNLLASVAAAQVLGIGKSQIAVGIATAPQVPGRLEQVANDRQILALVDYAHSSDALEQVLSTLAKLDAKQRITLVGCGGDRDPNKRPVMAATAARYSDLAIFTSDNPRTEDPVQILEQMRAGALADGAEELGPDQLAAGKKGFIVIPDRREAIGFASGRAKAGDLLLVAGKGHEDYQILGREKVHFDDREELALALQQTDEDSGADNHV